MALFPWLIGGLFVGNLLLMVVRGHREQRARQQRALDEQWQERRRTWRSALGPTEAPPPAAPVAEGPRTRAAHAALAAAHQRWSQAHARVDAQLRSATGHLSAGRQNEAVEALADEAPLEALSAASAAVQQARLPVQQSALAAARTSAEDLPAEQLARARDAIARARLPERWLQTHPLHPEPSKIHAALDALRSHDPLTSLTAVSAVRERLEAWRRAHDPMLRAAVEATELLAEVQPLVATLPDARPPEDPREAWAEARDQLARAHREAEADELRQARRSFELAAAALREVRMLVPVVLKAPERAPRAVDALQRQVDSQRQALQSARTSLTPWLGEEVADLAVLRVAEQRQDEAEAGITAAAEALEAGDPWAAMRHVREVEAVPTEPLTAVRTLVADLRFLERFAEAPERIDQRLRAARTRAVSAIRRGEGDPDVLLAPGDALREEAPARALAQWSQAWAEHRSAWRLQSQHQRLVRARAHRRQAPARPTEVLPKLPSWPY